jgi:GxxExxY protein
MNELQQWVLKTCTEISNTLGKGHSESIYHNAFGVELREAGYVWESEKVLPVVYKGIQVGFVKSDIVIRDELVLEFKALSRKLSETDVQQLKKYMEICGIDSGMLINFSRTDTVNKTVEFLII